MCIFLIRYICGYTDDNLLSLLSIDWNCQPRSLFFLSVQEYYPRNYTVMWRTKQLAHFQEIMPRMQMETLLLGAGNEKLNKIDVVVPLQHLWKKNSVPGCTGLKSTAYTRRWNLWLKSCKKDKLGDHRWWGNTARKWQVSHIREFVFPSLKLIFA